MNITHIVHKNKFTYGYISFMEYYFSSYNHTFFAAKGFIDEQKLLDNKHVILLNEVKELRKAHFKKKLAEADKIIVTGVFANIDDIILGMGKEILSKTYLQFWGGDFYSYRFIKISGFHTLKKALIHKRRLAYFIKHCAGVINLIPGDWDEFYKIFPYDVKHFVAPMPSDPNKVIDYGSYRRRADKKDVCRILVGNSATKTNCHIDAFEKLKVFANENVEIVVPLSYGDTGRYRDAVIESGTKIFGSKFHPVLDFMNKDEYIDLLNSCDVGVFNNDRQQGMGNISIMLSLGKKVYARKDTAMWSYYSSLGITFYDVCDIPHTSIIDFRLLDKEISDANITGMEKKRRHEYNVDLWREVFEDEL